MRKHYIALVHKDEDSDFGVSFPDFPGAVTAARTLDEALERAQKALALLLEGMAEDGEPIPPPLRLRRGHQGQPRRAARAGAAAIGEDRAMTATVR
jgi:predicted RNase H-like HicB family nuclease